jgi:hypothetical protein
VDQHSAAISWSSLCPHTALRSGKSSRWTSILPLHLGPFCVLILRCMCARSGMPRCASVYLCPPPPPTPTTISAAMTASQTCPGTTIYLSSYSYICVLILLNMLCSMTDLLLYVCPPLEKKLLYVLYMRPEATSVCGLKLLMYAALSY